MSKTITLWDEGIKKRKAFENRKKKVLQLSEFTSRKMLSFFKMKFENKPVHQILEFQIVKNDEYTDNLKHNKRSE